LGCGESNRGYKQPAGHALMRPVAEHGRVLAINATQCKQK
jgi:hypothetical protein